MRRAGVRAPKVGDVRVPGLVQGEAGLLEAHESFDGLRFSGADLDGRDLTGSTFMECEFSDVGAHDTDLRSARFADSRFDRLNAPVVSAPRSMFRDVVVNASRIGSAEFFDAEWNSVHLRGCKLGYINLRGARLENVLFTDCTIDELDLAGARADRVAFTGTRLDSLDVTGSTLADVDLRGAQLGRVTGLQGLRGATATSAQIATLAESFATHLGVLIEE